MFLKRLVSALLRLVIVTAGVAFGLLVVLMGLVLTLGLVVWGALRGRKPQGVDFRMHRGGSPFGAMRPAPRGDVVDIEAREVPDAPQRLTQDRA